MLNQSNQENVHTLRIVEVCDDGEIVYATGPMDRASSAPEGGISVYLDLNAAFNPMPSAMIVVAEGLVEDGVEIARTRQSFIAMVAIGRAHWMPLPRGKSLTR